MRKSKIEYKDIQLSRMFVQEDNKFIQTDIQFILHEKSLAGGFSLLILSELLLCLRKENAQKQPLHLSGM